ncbi:MAG: hypothetical protein ACM3S2_15275 [Ignavibacteriales bacterium]
MMNIQAILNIDLLGEPTPRQKKNFYQELSCRSWKEVPHAENKRLVAFDNIYSDEEAIERIKRNLSEVAAMTEIFKYSAIVHFPESNLVVFFCGQNEGNA